MSFRKLRKGSLFTRNFIILLTIFSIIFLLFSLYVYDNSMDILTREIGLSADGVLSNMSSSIDGYFNDARYIVAVLETNPKIRAFFTFEHPDLLYSDYELSVEDYLKAINESHEYIDSIYLYRESSHTIMSQAGQVNASLHSDPGWLELIDWEDDGIQFIFRAKKEWYPYLMSVVKCLEIDNEISVIVVNVDISKISYLDNYHEKESQSFYIIADDGLVIYQDDKNEFEQYADDIPYLQHYGQDSDTHSIFDSDNTYYYSQVRSSRFPWSYALVQQVSDYSAKLSDNMFTLLLSFIGLLAVGIVIALLMSLHTVKPIRELSRFAENPEDNLLNAKDTFGNTEAESIVDNIMLYVQSSRTLTEELTKRILLHKQTSLIALQAQINPHFLFNSLNVLHIQQCEILGYDHTLPRMTLGISKLLRYSIDGADLVLLKDELEFAKQYVFIMEQRYSNLFHTTYVIDENCLCAKVPKLIIQPLIENAILHGFLDADISGGQLTIASRMDGQNCVLSVTDNGGGISREKLQELNESIRQDGGYTEIGVKNVFTRMKLLYGNDFLMEIDSEIGKGSTFTLRFPAAR